MLEVKGSILEEMIYHHKWLKASVDSLGTSGVDLNKATKETITTKVDRVLTLATPRVN